LTPIEVAEGALLADVAVLFQLVWTYLPLPGILFRLLIPTVFAVIVLRQRLAVGFLALAVTVFVSGVVTGPNLIDLIYMCFEGFSGLFFGLTLQRHWKHVPILFLGGFGFALAGTLVAIVTVLAFLPISQVFKDYDQMYQSTVGAIDSVTTTIGLYPQWRAGVYPTYSALTSFTMKYWWLLIFLESCAIAVPRTLVIYGLTNFFVRLLGYDVQPFPGGFVHRQASRWSRRLVRFGVRHGMLRRQVPV
jgi:hypothetical protein